MAGEANRKIFFNDRNLAFSEAYQTLLGGQPNLEDINHNLDTEVSAFIKRLLLLFRKERINEGAPTICVSNILILTFASVFPLLLEDVNRRMKDWGSEGKINSSNEVYDVSLHLLIPYVYNDLII
jgi:hypothetical protein